jgi:hypothetical protein
MQIFVRLIMFCAFILTVECQTNTVDPESPVDSISTPATAPNQGDTTNVPTSIPTPADAKLRELIERAKTDLAQRLAISTREINIVEFFEVEWPDSSLGCPNPSLMYTQVVTPGYLIRLQALGRIFEFHTSKRNQIVYCDHPSAPLPGTLPDR